VYFKKEEIILPTNSLKAWRYQGETYATSLFRGDDGTVAVDCSMDQNLVVLLYGTIRKAMIEIVMRREE